MDFYGIEIDLHNLVKIDTKKYAEDLRIKFKNNPDLWYACILPKEAAERLREETGNDYSKVWDTYCESCFCNIDINSGFAYKSPKNDWLCEKCYEENINK